jgi:iron complex transport system substrate-binding protein
MRVFHELLGPLELPDRFGRIVSLAPNLTDALYALGLGDRLVGRSAFCHRPARVLSLPVVASYTKTRLDLLRRLGPDLVLLSTGVQREQALRLKEEGFPAATPASRGGFPPPSTLRWTWGGPSPWAGEATSPRPSSTWA